jgi:hypothetical protein
VGRGGSLRAASPRAYSHVTSLNIATMEKGKNEIVTRLYVNVRRTLDGPVLSRKDVSEADLWDYRAEAWQTMYLRRSQIDLALEDVHLDLRTIYASGQSGRLAGFALIAEGPTGKRLSHTFSLHAVEHIAVGASRELIDAGVLRSGDEYYYELMAEKMPPLAKSVNGGIAISTATAKLQFVRHPIRDLWKQAKKLGPEDPKSPPVFYTKEALSRATSYARRGGNQKPPIETGCILIGVPCSCPETGEFYIVIRDALEAQDAESKTFSLEYTGQTWTRLQAILRARQSRADRRADRFVGQAHGHLFLPAGGAPPCDICAGKPDVPCSRTSCFASVDDSTWSRAVFARQPWQLCHIFGLNARAEHVDKLFGLRDGQLQERGYAVVPEFTPHEPLQPQSRASHELQSAAKP